LNCARPIPWSFLSKVCSEIRGLEEAPEADSIFIVQKYGATPKTKKKTYFQAIEISLIYQKCDWHFDVCRRLPTEWSNYYHHERSEGLNDNRRMKKGETQLRISPFDRLI
jgi:hypothetical protein